MSTISLYLFFFFLFVCLFVSLTPDAISLFTFSIKMIFFPCCLETPKTLLSISCLFCFNLLFSFPLISRKLRYNMSLVTRLFALVDHRGLALTEGGASRFRSLGTMHLQVGKS